MTSMFGRMALAPFARRSPLFSTALLAIDLIAYAALVAGAIAAESVWLKLVFGFGAGTLIALAAIVGHDAGHQSFSGNRRLNRVCGTIAFLPALHPFCLWEHHHNRVHHRYTVQLGLDNAFAPMTVDQYRAASPWQRARYRFMRSLWGQPLFYLVDIWWPDMWIPWASRKTPMTPRAWFDLAIVYAWFILFMAGTTWLSLALHGGTVEDAALSAFVFAFAFPFLVWNAFISFLSIVQHTGPDTRWIEPTGAPTTVEQALAGTVHIVFPEWLDRLFHRIMQHQAHHVHVGVPLQAVKAAQSTTSTATGGTLVRAWTPAYHLELTRTCQLWDTKANRWRTFSDAYDDSVPLDLAA